MPGWTFRSGKDVCGEHRLTYGSAVGNNGEPASRHQCVDVLHGNDNVAGILSMTRATGLTVHQCVDVLHGNDNVAGIPSMTRATGLTVHTYSFTLSTWGTNTGTYRQA